MNSNQIPKSIVKAVCAIQATVESVKKTQKNQHGGYLFASTDDIYAAVTKKMGEVGLMILPIENEHEIVRVEKDGKTSQWLRVEFGFVLATVDDTYAHPHARRSLYIQVTGPQTHQAAQSYAEKAFLRSLFKLPTGDLDLDSMPQADSEEDQVALNGNGKKRKSSSGAKKDGTFDKFEEIKLAIADAASSDVLVHLRKVYDDEWKVMPSKWGEILDHEYEDKMDDLGGSSNGAML